MYLKFVSCLWYFALFLGARSQIINSWALPQSDYADNSGFSNWGSNGGNVFSNNPPGTGSWDLNAPRKVQPVSDLGDVYSTWQSNSFNNNGNKKSFSIVSNNKQTDEWNSNAFNFNARPGNEFTSSSLENGKIGYETQLGNENLGSSTWNSNKELKEQNSNWQSDAFNTNNRPNERKGSSASNNPTSTNWNSNSDSNNTPNEKKGSFFSSNPSTSWNTHSNKFSSDSEDNSEYSSWGSGKDWKSPTSNNQNSNSQNWESNNLSNNEPNGNNYSSDSDSEDNSVYSNYKKRQKPRPSNVYANSGKPSGSNNWESTTQINKKQESTVWGSKNNKKSDDKKSSSSNNSGYNSWNSNQFNNRPNEEKPSENGRNPGDNKKLSSTQEYKKPAALDASLLDELDKNDWYFGNDSNYPKPPFKSNLNIDVSELWNFEKNKKPKPNSGRGYKNDGRRNREVGHRIKCECVDVTLCEEDDMIITKEDATGDERLLEVFRCRDLTEVCCTKPKANQSKTTIDVMHEPLHCGETKISRKIFRNLDDEIAEPEEFPWMLRLENPENDVGCGASLIHAQMALTAAHCVARMQPEDLNVRAGMWNSDKEPSQSRRVIKIILHPGYNSEMPRNDLALLVLEKPFKLTDNVNTICLPITNDKWDSNRCILADLASKEITGGPTEILSKGVISFLPQPECQNILRATDMWRHYVLHNTFVCAVEKNIKNACLGDEGSALMCPSIKSANAYLQIGIVSKSINCDDFGRPGIFTNVLMFLDWINEQTFELGLFDDIDVRML